ncbi:unnamed protein product [Timema podura]|uniref:Uncharacterized protein n=1 Tax=Timema podura TaxID=61482 RepID=A0ABN7P0M2_TIMPD|nr:unnamed protein product [Timema podura]
MLQTQDRDLKEYMYMLKQFILNRWEGAGLVLSVDVTSVFIGGEGLVEMLSLVAGWRKMFPTHAKSSSPHELRTDRRHTDRFTLNMNQQGRRHSRRKQGTQRTTYHSYM